MLVRLFSVARLGVGGRAARASATLLGRTSDQTIYVLKVSLWCMDDRRTHALRIAVRVGEFRLDGDRVDAVAVHALPDATGDIHVLDTRLDEDMHRGNDGRLGQLPDVQLVNRDHTWHRLHRVPNAVQGDVGWNRLHEDIRGGFDFMSVDHYESSRRNNSPRGTAEEKMMQVMKSETAGSKYRVHPP
jgi:hypothetical protein